MMIGGTNSTVLSAYNMLNSTNKALEKTARALSTGLRTATAADDASGFAMGIKISAQIAGVDRAIRNSQDGVSLLQTAEGGLNEINSMLQRMRELTLQAANDTLTTQDRNYIQNEIGALRDSINNVASNTTFNSKRLLDGSSSAEWSSDSKNVNVNVTGALTEIDRFGQRKPIEGNYKIEIRAKPGQAEVKKSAILDVTQAKEVWRTETVNGQEVMIRDVEIEPVKLQDMQAFTDANGNRMLEHPQTITIVQGDGRTADVTLYGSDTLDDVREKINSAIANDLGQGKYTDNVNNFCTISDGTQGIESVNTQTEVYRPVYERDSNGELVLDDDGNPKELTDERELAGYTTKASIIVRSVVPGSDGRLTFTSDNQDLVNALGLTNIREASDTVFTASVYDAHSQTVLAKNVTLNGNRLEGVISENVTLDFNAMTNTHAVWSENAKNYVLTADSNPEVMTVHLKDKSTAFQVGQNPGEDMYIQIGDMRAEALGLDKVNVTTRSQASQSISVLDAAIKKISAQRTKIGAYQNELEYNTNSLTETSLHMQESESRIKDADMATEYMEFIKLQILNNTGSSMLSQANQNSQSILSILQV